MQRICLGLELVILVFWGSKMSVKPRFSKANILNVELFPQWHSRLKYLVNVELTSEHTSFCK